MIKNGEKYSIVTIIVILAVVGTAVAGMLTLQNNNTVEIPQSEISSVQVSTPQEQVKFLTSLSGEFEGYVTELELVAILEGTNQLAITSDEKISVELKSKGLTGQKELLSKYHALSIAPKLEPKVTVENSDVVLYKIVISSVKGEQTDGDNN